MNPYSNFLHAEAYRKTFLTYLGIVLAFLVTILGFMYRDIQKTARENFLREASQACDGIDRKAQALVTSIDQFSAQIYSTPGLSNDFFRFFGATAQEYTTRRLDLPTEPEASILSAFKTLVLNSDNSIRHVICYARENVVDLEFNDQGDSRHRILTTGEADRICQSGCIYQKDIHRDSAYYGKISLVLDLSRFVDEPLQNAEGRGVHLVLSHRVIPSGEIQLTEAQVQQLMDQGGFPRKLPWNSDALYSLTYTSHCLPYSILYVASARELLAPLYWKFLVVALCCLLAFSAITLVLIRLFSRDTAYISAILRSMAQAEKGSFTPVALTGYSPEYDAIVRGLNDLYAHLERVIQREYKLTISQQKAQMGMLSAQLSPHFLYNTLERIRMRAVLNNDPEVAEATAGLGLLYRNIVKTEPVIPMSRELEITRQYLDLMTFLYGDQLLYYFDVDESLNAMETPKIWMQPIVENFFKHNFQQDDRIKVVVVELTATEAGFEGRFFDNIGSIDKEQLDQINTRLRSGSEEDQGIGLHNVLHRLQLFYGSGLQITMENNDPAGVCIHISMKREESGHVPTADCR